MNKRTNEVSVAQLQFENKVLRDHNKQLTTNLSKIAKLLNKEEKWSYCPCCHELRDEWFLCVGCSQNCCFNCDEVVCQGCEEDLCKTCCDNNAVACTNCGDYFCVHCKEGKESKLVNIDNNMVCDKCCFEYLKHPLK